VEGNIGAGKSTLLQAVGVGGRPAPRVAVLCEPIDEWCRPISDGAEGAEGAEGVGASALELMYADPAENGLAFQVFAAATRTLDALRVPADADVVLYERNPFDADIFPALQRRRGAFSAFDAHAHRALLRALSTARPDLAPVAHVYLRASPETCLRRVRARARGQETTVDLRYLAELHELHEEWYRGALAAGTPVLLLDAEVEAEGGVPHVGALTRFIAGLLPGADL
jgi:deoxyadenosine/deoxycytidine kinase